MLSNFKFRLYPTKPQAKVMDEALETCRRLYNSLLAERMRNGTGFYDQKKMLVEWKNNDKHLKSVHSQVLQDVVLRLDKAFQAFFVGLNRHPKFRRRGRYLSFTYPQSGFKLEGNRIRLSAVGNVRVKIHREITGAIRRVTVIKDVDQWFVSVLVEEGPSGIQSAEGVVGVDMGVFNLVAMSDGSLAENPRLLRHAMPQIKSLQRSLARKKRGSKNKEKARLSLARTWRRVRRQNDDFAHKLSDRLTKENRFIVFENLRIGNLVKNHSLASAIMDSAWGKLRRLTAFKAEKRGGRVILVEPAWTSQKCSGCGVMNPRMRDLSRRFFECAACGLVLERDVNAARNILQAGLERARVEKQPLLIQRRRVSKFASVKQEVHAVEPY